MATEFVDLLTDSGEIIRIECPEKYADELHESLDNAMKTNSWWSPARFEGCIAEVFGTRVSRVAMRRVVAVL